MSTPYGALANTAVSLAKTTKNPTISNIVAIAPVATQIDTGNVNLNSAVTNGASLIGSASQLLSSGSSYEAVSTVNTAVRLAQGFLDPKTAATVGAIAGGLNQLFGIGSVFGGALGIGAAGGNKPIALHTESLPSQDMASAYSEKNDVVFTFVRADSNIPTGATGDGSGIDMDWPTSLNTDLSGIAPAVSAPTSLSSQFSPVATGTVPPASASFYSSF